MEQQQETTQAKPAATAEPLDVRIKAWVQSMWRPAGTAFVVSLALLLGWNVVNGKHGLSAWQKQRVEHKKLNQEIDDLQQENSKLKDHINRLKSDPDAIEHEAREQLHYARPGEVIVALPPDPKAAGQAAETK